MSLFISQIADRGSPISQIADRCHRRSLIADFIQWFMPPSAMFAMCDVAYRRSAFLEGLLFRERLGCMRCDEFRIALSQFCFPRLCNASAFPCDAI